jgi:hypothetical protein
MRSRGRCETNKVGVLSPHYPDVLARLAVAAPRTRLRRLPLRQGPARRHPNNLNHIESHGHEMDGGCEGRFV